MTEAIIPVVALLLGLAVGFAVGRRVGGGAQLATARAEAAALRERIELDATAAAEREQRLIADHHRYMEQVRGDQDRLAQQFKALSADALKANQETFLSAANERLARTQLSHQEELEKRERAVRQLVEPMRETLDKVEKQTTAAEQARVATQAQLTEQIRRMLDTSETLGRQTESLRSALRCPEVRGRWGELHLRRVVEVAGLVNGVDFEEQAFGTTDEGARLRPDMIVTLSGGRRIVVDAKTPLDALLDMEAEPTDYDVYAARHVENVRKRVQELGSKSYRDQFDSKVDFSVLFLPAESFLQVATERDPSLLTWAYDKGVIIATPTVLVAMLRTVALAWREETLAKDAQKVLDTGKELYERLSKMGDHLAKVGKAIDSAGRTYNDMVGSMERRVLPKAREFAALQQVAPAESPALVDNVPRVPQARELVWDDPAEPPAADGDTQALAADADSPKSPLSDA